MKFVPLNPSYRNTAVKKRVLVFASGSANGGGSGFRNLVEQSRARNLPFEVVGVVTHHENGGVINHANKLGTHPVVAPLRVSTENYRSIFKFFQPDLVALSGWLRPVTGLPTEKVINIHPGPLPEFGGNGFYGHRVHEAVMSAYRAGKVSQSAVSMHFVPPYQKHEGGDNYDTGPIFAFVPVPIEDDDDADSLGARVNQKEHLIQPAFTALVAEGCIKLRPDGTVWMEDPAWYEGKNLPYT